MAAANLGHDASGDGAASRAHRIDVGMVALAVQTQVVQTRVDLAAVHDGTLVTQIAVLRLHVLLQSGGDHLVTSDDDEDQEFHYAYLHVALVVEGAVAFLAGV